jgi:jasmonoyl-L-amino acid 12-hydroxylase
MGRTRAIWGEDAKDFRPERWLHMKKTPSPFDYPVFNAGPRICPGRSMAQLEVCFVLVSVLRRFRVCVSRVGEVTYVPSLTLHIKGGLPCTIQNRTTECSL